jgi:hypothetical protein
MLVEVNINNYDITSKNFCKEFNHTSTFDEIKDDYINELDLINTINDFNKSKLYFFANDIVIRPNTKILDVMETVRKYLFVTALYDFDNNFSIDNTYVWISHVKIGNYYMFCPPNMKISEVINKYKTYFESKNIFSDKVKFAHLGRGVNEDDTIGKYSTTSNYAVFIATTY